MGAVVGVWKAVSVVTPALLPGTVLGIPTAGAMLLPIATLFALLCTLLLRRAPYFRVLRVLVLLLLLLGALLIVPALLLLLRALGLLTPILLLGTLRLLCPLLLLRTLGLLLLAALGLLSALWLLSTLGPLRLLASLCLLGALWLLCPLLLLRALRLLLLLAPLRLLGTLRLLCALRPLRLLAALRLLSLLLLLFFILVLLWSRLRVAKSGGSQQQERKKCGADNSESFHQVCLSYSLGLRRNISCTFWDVRRFRGRERVPPLRLWPSGWRTKTEAFMPILDEIRESCYKRLFLNLSACDPWGSSGSFKSSGGRMSLGAWTNRFIRVSRRSREDF